MPMSHRLVYTAKNSSNEIVLRFFFAALAFLMIFSLTSSVLYLHRYRLRAIVVIIERLGGIFDARTADTYLKLEQL